MEKILTIIIFLLFTTSIIAQTWEDREWEFLVETIAKVESGGNPKAISPGGAYVGYLQISVEMVQECNRIVGYKKYTLKDRLNKEKSIEMFLEFQKHHNKEANIEKAIRLWNSGDIRCMEPKRKLKTENYYRKVIGYLESYSLVVES